MAVAAVTSPIPTQASDKSVKTRPGKPDEEQYKKDLAAAEREHSDAMARYNSIREKIEMATPSKHKDALSPTQQRKQELIAQAAAIRQQQAGGKSARTSKQDQIKRLDDQLRSRIAEQKTSRAKIPYKSADELDHRIESLDHEVNTGKMRLVDEKKHLAELSSLRKLRKNFSQFDDAQRQIDDLRVKIKEIKDGMEDPEQKELSARYDKVQSELNAIKAESDEAYKNLSSLRDERSRLQSEQQAKYTAVKKLKDDYYGAKKAWAIHEREARDKARERQRLERERVAREKRQEQAQRLLAEASDPAYMDEIRRAVSLLRFLDPDYEDDSAATKKIPLLADSGLGAQAQRKVDDSGMKGLKLLKKEDRLEEYLPAQRKARKGKKGAAEGPAKSGAFSCPQPVIEDCAAMGIDPPMSAADVPAVVEKVKAKLEKWKTDQAEQTRKNIEKAKKEIERLEREDAAASGTNGAEESGGVEEVTADIGGTSIEDTALNEDSKGNKGGMEEDAKADVEAESKEEFGEGPEMETNEEETKEEETKEEESKEDEPKEEETKEEETKEELKEDGLEEESNGEELKEESEGEELKEESKEDLKEGSEEESKGGGA